MIEGLMQSADAAVAHKLLHNALQAAMVQVEDVVIAQLLEALCSSLGHTLAVAGQQTLPQPTRPTHSANTTKSSP